jgi:hypothetical protein
MWKGIMILYSVEWRCTFSGLLFCLGEWGGKGEGSVYGWRAFVRVLKIAFGNMV